VAETKYNQILNAKSNFLDKQSIIKNDSGKAVKQNLGIDYDGAKKLVDKYIIEQKTRLHLRESEAIMRSLAEYLGENEEEWGIIGLLHDIDWDETKNNIKNHTVMAEEILRQAGASEFLIESVVSHCFGNEQCGQYQDRQRNTKLQHCLAAAETATGLIFASALMQPDKKLAAVKLSSLKKKFKDKSFAANCDREIIRECEQAGIELDKFLEIGLEAMKSIAGEIGL
jgi:putative nucleotidyltransferase with HDIG domain